VSNGANFKCQMGRLSLYAKWGDSTDKCQKGRLLFYFIKCQMGRFNGILSAKKGEYYYIILSSAKWDDYSYMPNGAIQWIFKCQMRRLKLLCQLRRYPDHGLCAFHASTLSLESCVLTTNILGTKGDMMCA